jgi:hypothetical protein
VEGIVALSAGNGVEGRLSRAAVPGVGGPADKVKKGSRVAIIGGGNAAIDSARTVLRMGANATILYRRERKDMPAIDEEIQAAEEEGVKFVFLAAPHRILGDADGNVKAIEIVKTRLGEYDKSGRRRPIPTDEVQRFECDSVILAVGETFDVDFCKASGLELKEEGTIEVDRFTLETSRPNFYAGGDVITGASNVSNAMGGGKQAARKIDERLMGEQRWEQLFPEFEYSRQAPGEPSLSRRHTGHCCWPSIEGPFAGRSGCRPHSGRGAGRSSPVPALRSESRCQRPLRKERRFARQNDFRPHRRRTGDRPRGTNHPGSGQRQREAYSHALLSEGPERRGSLPGVHGGTGGAPTGCCRPAPLPSRMGCRSRRPRRS